MALHLFAGIDMLAIGLFLFHKHEAISQLLVEVEGVAGMQKREIAGCWCFGIARQPSSRRIEIGQVILRASEN